MSNKYKIYTEMPIISKGKIKEEEKETKNNSKLLTIGLIFFIIIFLLFSGYSMAKIIGETIIIKTQGEIAKPILEVENIKPIDITEVNNSGIYTFKVKNYNTQNEVTEIELKYYIEILSDLDDTIDIEVLEDGNRLDLVENKTNYIEMLNKEKVDKEYQIKVTYTKDDTKPMSDILEKIKIKIHTEQVA